MLVLESAEVNAADSFQGSALSYGIQAQLQQAVELPIAAGVEMNKNGAERHRNGILRHPATAVSWQTAGCANAARMVCRKEKALNSKGKSTK